MHKAIQRYNFNKWANNRVFDHLYSLPDQVYSREIRAMSMMIWTFRSHRSSIPSPACTA